MRRGLPEYGLTADIEQAVDFYNKAATWFDEADAQFELAKLYLVGEGVPKDVKLGLYYLQKLTQQSHAPAQAFLADLHWQGKLLPREPNKALALIRLAVANAPRQERLWIEDIYQKVYCGTSSDVRSNADGLVMRWQRAFGSQAAPEPAPQGGADGELKPARACHNGEPVEIKNGLGAGNNPFSNFAPSAPDLRLGTKPVGQPGPR